MFCTARDFLLLVVVMMAAIPLAHGQTQQDFDAARERQRALQNRAQQQQLQQQQQIQRNQREWERREQFEQNLETQRRLDALEIQRRQQELDNPNPPVIVVPGAPAYGYPAPGYGYSQPYPVPNACRTFRPAFDQYGRQIGQVCAD